MGENYKNPILTVDVIIRYKGGIVLIKRNVEPIGWALPGGHVEYGETVENAAIREAIEETGLNVRLDRQFHVYSAKDRHPTEHRVTIVFVAEATGEIKASSDADEAEVFSEGKLPKNIVFDHKLILIDYFNDAY